MKNKLTDLNDHLFSQMERLGDEDLTDDQLEKEIKRAQSMIGIADKVIGNSTLMLKAAELRAEYQGGSGIDLPKTLTGPTGSDSNG